MSKVSGFCLSPMHIVSIVPDTALAEEHLRCKIEVEFDNPYLKLFAFLFLFCLQAFF